MAGPLQRLLLPCEPSALLERPRPRLARLASPRRELVWLQSTEERGAGERGWIALGPRAKRERESAVLCAECEFSGLKGTKMRNAK